MTWAEPVSMKMLLDTNVLWWNICTCSLMCVYEANNLCMSMFTKYTSNSTLHRIYRVRKTRSLEQWITAAERTVPSSLYLCQRLVWFFVCFLVFGFPPLAFLPSCSVHNTFCIGQLSLQHLVSSAAPWWLLWGKVEAGWNFGSSAGAPKSMEYPVGPSCSVHCSLLHFTLAG